MSINLSRMFGRETYASKEDSVKVLVANGFKLCFDDNDEEGPYFFDRAGSISGCTARLYLSAAGYWCVKLDGDHIWGAPVVWTGPKADWDKTDTSEEFRTCLIDNYGKEI